MNLDEYKLSVVSVRLVHDAPLLSQSRITSPYDAVKLIGETLCEMDREVLCVLNLNSYGNPINCTFASIGGLNETLANPRELLKASILSNAANMMLIHNHPSGSLDPSKQDTMITDRMLKLCDLVGIPLLDHIIVAGNNNRYFSYLERGLMSFDSPTYNTDYRNLEFNVINAPDSCVSEPSKRRGR